jgi:hypothetical protein
MEDIHPKNENLKCIYDERKRGMWRRLEANLISCPAILQRTKTGTTWLCDDGGMMMSGESCTAMNW